MKKPSLTQIRKALSSSAFDPRKPGPMAVITDISNLEFLRGRAIEILSESLNPDKLTKAIQLIAYLKATIELERKEKKNEKAVVKSDESNLPK
jgi:hypothetical protein